MRYRIIAKYDGRSAEDYVIQPTLDRAITMARIIVRGNVNRGGKLAREVWMHGDIVLVDENLKRHPMTNLRAIQGGE